MPNLRLIDIPKMTSLWDHPFQDDGKERRQLLLCNHAMHVEAALLD